MDVTSVPGSFEIDTICTYPANHVMLIVSIPGSIKSLAIIPAFTKGVITIADCSCSFHGDLDGDGQITALDMDLLIDYLYASGPAPPTDPGCPHTDRGDVNCDGFDDALDAGFMIDHLFAGGPPPCDPCACDLYPTDCP